MKRSGSVNLVLLLTAAATLESCNHQQCVDEHGTVVEDKYCHTSNFPGPHGYRYYSGGWFAGSRPLGSSVNDSAGTSRGVFGSAGESAGHSGGGVGAGE